MCLLAPIGVASYSVSVRRLGRSLHASFSVDLTLDHLALHLRFLQPVSSEDFHLPASFHAGHTQIKNLSNLRGFLILVAGAGFEPAAFRL